MEEKVEKTSWYSRNKDSVSKRQKIYSQSKHGRFMKYRKSSKERNIKFDLTEEQFLQFWDKRCFYCGLDVDGVGLDRLDSSDGYILYNVVSCCSVCNRMKNDYGLDFFLERCELIVNNVFNK